MNRTCKFLSVALALGVFILPAKTVFADAASDAAAIRAQEEARAAAERAAQQAQAEAQRKAAERQAIQNMR